MKETALTLSSLADNALRQRLERMTDHGPPLRGLGAATFQIHGSTLFVGGVRARRGREATLIERVMRFARERWLGISWLHTEGQDDRQIVAELRNFGFAFRETLRLMGCIGQLHPIPPHRDDLVVKPVETRDQMEQYERISQWGFGENTAPLPQQIALRGQERWEEQLSHLYQYYVAWLDRHPISGAYVSLWERVPTIYGVLTIPPARRSGAAALVMQTLVRATLARGFPWTCLYVAVGNPAQRLYEQLGYAPLYEQTTYTWRDIYR